jgi:hypothetical protein
MMQRAELTRMGIALAVALVAMSYLAVDAGVVNTGVVTDRIKVAKASIVDAAMARPQLAFAVHAWTRHGHEKPALEQCLAID